MDEKGINAIDKAVNGIVSEVRELKRAEDMNDWHKVQDCARSIKRHGEKIRKISIEAYI